MSGNAKPCDHGKYHLRASEKREQGASGLNGKSLREEAERYEKHLRSRNSPKEVANVRKPLSVLGGIVQMFVLVACLF